MRLLLFIGICASVLVACKSKGDDPAPVPAGPFNLLQMQINATASGPDYVNVPAQPIIKFSFSAPVDQASVKPNVLLNELNGASVAYNVGYERNDSTIVIQPASPLKYLTKYTLRVFP